MVRVISTADLGGDYRGEDGADGWTYEKPVKPASPPSKPHPTPSAEPVAPFKISGGKHISNLKKGLL